MVRLVGHADRNAYRVLVANPVGKYLKILKETGCRGMVIIHLVQENK